MSKVNIYQSISTQKYLQFVNLSSQLESPQQIVFIDSNVEDYEGLANGVLLGTKVVILRPSSDCVQQITKVIKKYPYISSIHLVSHGGPGCLYLGNNQLNINSIDNDYYEELGTWSVTNLLLYGCNVGAGSAGKEFLARLREITGANIAASAKPTGNVALGGDWELEVIRGQLEVYVPFTQETQQEWNYVLTPFAEKPELFQVLNPNTTPDDQLFRLNPLTGNYEGVGGTGTPRYNAAGYNTSDNYIYGFEVAGSNQKLVRIDSTGLVEYVKNNGNPPDTNDSDPNNFTINLFPSPNNPVAGDIDGSNNLWVTSLTDKTSVVRVSNINGTPTAALIPLTGTQPTGDMPGDLTFINDILYGISGDGELVTIDTFSQTINATAAIGIDVGGTLGGVTYGAAWTDVEGKLYVSANDGELYHIRDYTTTPVAEELLPTQATISNDGMSDPDQKSVFDIPLIDLSGTGTPENLNHEDTFTEGDTGVDIVDITPGNNGLVIEDFINNGTTANGGRLASATITLTNPFSDDELFIPGSIPAGITPFVPGSGDVVSLTADSGTASVADFENAIKAIQFRNTSEVPDDTDRTIQFVLMDEDGNSSDDFFANPATERPTTTITVIPVNDAPTFSALDNTPTFVGNPVVLDNDATIADPELDDRNNYDGATLTLERNGGANAEDVFSSGDPSVLGTLIEGDPLTVNGTTIGTVTTNNSGTLLLTFNGSATGALVDSALQNIGYSNGTPTPGTVTIDYTINDGNTAPEDQGAGGPLTGSGSITVNISNSTPVPFDFNADGVADILWRNGTNGLNRISLLNNGGTLNSSVNPGKVSPDSSWEVAGVGDFNADGVSDILWHDGTNGLNRIWLMDNEGTFNSSADLLAAPYSEVAGVEDFNGDGVADILWHSHYTGNSISLLNNGGTLNSSVNLGTVGLYSEVVAGVGDFNADGVADILWRNGTTGANSISLLNNDGTFKSSANPGTVGPAWDVAGVGDFDADGVADILWRNGTTGANRIYLLNNDGTFDTSANPGTVGPAWDAAQVADFNADGVADILWRNGTNGLNSISLLNNGGTFNSSANPGTVGPAWDVAGM